MCNDIGSRLGDTILSLALMGLVLNSGTKGLNRNGMKQINYVILSHSVLNGVVQTLCHLNLQIRQISESITVGSS